MVCKKLWSSGSALLAILAGCHWGPGAQLTQTHGNNALWVQSLYFRGFTPSDGRRLNASDIDALVNTVNANGIKYIYMFAGPYGKDGRLPSYAFGPSAIQITVQLRDRCPGVVILPWVGGVVNRTVFLDNPLWVANAIADTERIIQTLHVPGVHVNFEFFTYDIPGEAPPGFRGISHYGDDECAFYRRLRHRLPSAFISAVIESTAKQAVQWKRKNSKDEVIKLSEVVDQVAILCFDTSLKAQERFQDALHAQLLDIVAWKRMTASRRVEYLIGLGTFVNKPELWQFRDLTIESLSNTIGTVSTLENADLKARNAADGWAIFADWTTTPSQWMEFERSYGKWRMRRHPQVSDRLIQLHRR